MNQYETIIIINPNMDSELTGKFVEDVTSLITGDGGTITKTENWGKKKLAYEIKGNKDGIYILLRFEAAPSFIQRFERSLVLNEQVVKYMTVRAEDLPEPRQKELTIRKFDEEDEDEFLHDDYRDRDDMEDEDYDDEDEDDE